jgi:hypothetical protein
MHTERYYGIRVDLPGLSTHMHGVGGFKPRYVHQTPPAVFPTKAVLGAANQPVQKLAISAAVL